MGVVLPPTRFQYDGVCAQTCSVTSSKLEIIAVDRGGAATLAKVWLYMAMMVPTIHVKFAFFQRETARTWGKPPFWDKVMFKKDQP